MRVDDKSTGKKIILGYDSLIANPVDNSECSYCLTIPQVQAILSLSEFMYWKTRWLSRSGIDLTTATAMQNMEEFTEDLRRRLMSGCCPEPVFTRINEAGVYQTSVDGVTWVDAPLAEDPREQPVQLPPQTGTSPGDAKCKQANSMIAYLQDAQAKQKADLDAGATLASIVAVIISILALIGIIGTGGALAPLLLLLASGIITATGTEFDAEFTSQKWADFACVIWCNLTDAGKIDGEVGYAAIQQAVKDIWGENSLGGHWLLGLVQLLGQGGMNNTGAIPSTLNIDCTVCGCSFAWEWDLTNAVENAIMVKGAGRGHWTAGTGWVSDYSASDQKRFCDHLKFNWGKTYTPTFIKFGYHAENVNTAQIRFQGTEGTNPNQSLVGLDNGDFLEAFPYVDCGPCTDDADHLPEVVFGALFAGTNAINQVHHLKRIRLVSSDKMSFNTGHAIDPNAP